MAQEITTGDLKHKVVFKQPVSSLNDRGETETSYTISLITFAKVDRFNQFRSPEANDTTLVGALDFTIRSSIQTRLINKDWLIEYKAEEYTIHQIEEIDQVQVFIRFTAKVMTNG